MKFESVADARTFIEQADSINLDDGFALTRFCAGLALEIESENEGRDLVIRALDNLAKFAKETIPIWNDLLEIYGLYPYLDANNLSLLASLRHEYHRAAHLPDEIYFHAEQAQIASRLRSGESVIASAPTSFGKSLLIDEVVASGRHENIVVIQPTLALLDETRKRFRRFHEKYHLVLSTSQKPASIKGNLFLFTAERVVEYESFPPISFFVIDEFYKLSLNREDDRAITLNQALYKLLKHTKQFYLLGPPVDGVPDPKHSKVPYYFFPSKFATVATDEIELASKSFTNDEKRGILFKALDSFEDQSIIYCAAPPGAMNLATQYADWLDSSLVRENESVPEEIQAMSDWISENISPDWCLRRLLRKGIAFHHGALPRHLGSALVDAFNAGTIKYLFCTATLIEGVNTTAKNIVLYDRKKGVRPIDYFDFRNIAGRSGRMNFHFIGKVYKFHETPDQKDLYIDIPVLTQTDAPPELLMSLDEVDLNTEGKKRIEGYKSLDPDLKEVLKKHAAMPLEGQLKVVQLIESHKWEWLNLLNWRSFPDYDQLCHVCDLAWNHLRHKREAKRGIFSPAQLATVSLQYSRLRSVKAVINQQLNSDYWVKREPEHVKRVDPVVHNTLEIARHWFDYKLGTFLGAISDIQEYVYNRAGVAAGDYKAFAAQVESGFLSQKFAGLSEYGIPRSAIEKISKRFGSAESVEEVIEALRRSDLASFGFSPYELLKVKQAL